VGGGEYRMNERMGKKGREEEERIE